MRVEVRFRFDSTNPGRSGDVHVLVFFTGVKIHVEPEPVHNRAKPHDGHTASHKSHVAAPHLHRNAAGAKLTQGLSRHTSPGTASLYDNFGQFNWLDNPLTF